MASALQSLRNLFSPGHSLLQRPFRRRKNPLTLEQLEMRRVLASNALGEVSGIVSIDADGDGIFDPGEGVSGASMELFEDTDGNNELNPAVDRQVDITTTNSVGKYTFSNLTFGNYFAVQPRQPVGGNTLPERTSDRVSVTGTGVSGSTIDRFDTASGPTVDTSPPGTPVEAVHAAGDAIGGQRDFVVSFLSGSNEDEVSLRSTGTGLLKFNPDVTAIGEYTSIWDGIDAAGDGLDPTGLGGIDLTELGGISGRSAGICLHSVFVDHAGVVIQMRIYSNANEYSEATISNIPADEPKDFFIPFSGSNDGLQFVPMGTSGGADFTDVGAISLKLAASQIATDGQLGLLNALAPDVATANFQNDPPTPAIDIEKLTNGNDADDATDPDVPLVDSGSTVTWTYRVTNVGQADLEDVIVSDDVMGIVDDIVSRLGGDNDNILEPGETWIYEATGVAIDGSYENKGTVTANTAGGMNVMDMDWSHYVGANADIDIEKFTDGIQADDADDDDVPQLNVGETVVWTYRVSNSGTMDLNDVQVTDNVMGTIVNIVDRTGDGDNVLEPGEVWDYEASGIVRAGAYENRGSVTSQSPTGRTVTDVDFSHYVGIAPSIDLEKATNGLDADVVGTGPQVYVGQNVVFTYEVRNTGTVALSDVLVEDDNGTVDNAADDFFADFSGGDANNNDLLDLTEIWEYRASRTANLGAYQNVARVTASAPNRQTVSDSDASNHSAVARPAMFSKRRFLASSF